jgi:acyl transferase domain-containing protein/aryl carrier-like protein
MTTSRTSDQPREPLAIIGIGCHLPGGVTSAGEFWDLLSAGADATRPVPADRWEVTKFYDPDPGKLGKMSTSRGGFLDRVDEFDAQFFGISPREAVWLDPQQRLLLRAAWEALEDAGQDVHRLAGSSTGVFMGGFTLDYQLLQNYGVQSRYEFQAHSATGMMMTMLANRLSYAFDFRGPSMTVDTACSGSLVAVHLAAQALWSGECALALAGGVNVMLAPNMTIAESKGGFLSPDGRCKTFSAAANGYARGEGAGVVVLKPLSRAQQDGDVVYATIIGTAVSQDGHTDGITVPNGAAQEAAMRAAYDRAGVTPDKIHYLEAHGTGTPVGDPIEVRAIGRVLAEGRASTDPVVVGSVKTNIGHLEAAAGVAGLIKTALVLQRGRIPANLHFDDPNPAIPFDELHVRVPTAAEDWPADGGPRYAGVNSFGFGGTNAHVVLRDVPGADVSRPRSGGDRPRLLALSARSPEALTDLAASMSRFLQQDTSRFQDVVHSCGRRRTHHEHRLAVIATSGAEAAEQLAAFAGGGQPAGVATGRVSGAARPKLAFVCTGMGPQWWGMARELLASEPVFRAAVERCDAELARYTGWSLLAEMLQDEEHSRMEETEVAQPANFAVQVGLAELWCSWGVVPDAVVGHSTGEVAAQYLAGVLSFEDAIKVNYYRSSLQQRATGTGRMLAVGMTPETLDQAVADAGPLVSVAAVNSPSAVTLSGDAQVLQGMADQLETFGVFHRFLAVKVPYHSHYMDQLRDDLLDGLRDIRPREARVPLYSTVTGTRIDGRTADARYWWQNVRATVLFQAAFSQLVADGHTHFLEVGPHPVLAGAMREVLSQSQTDGLIVPSMRRGAAEAELMRHSLGTLHCNGHPIDWEQISGDDVRYVKLPTYPWQVRSYWNESVEAREDRHYDRVHPLLGQRMNAPHPTWEHEVNPGVHGYLADHRIQGNVLLPAAGFIEMALAAAREVYGEADLCLEELELRRALVLGPAADPRVRTTLTEHTGEVEFASFVAHPGGDRTWAVNATTRVSGQPAPRRVLDLRELRAPLTDQLGHEEFYELTRSLGFEYGPAFQTVQSVRMGGGTAVASVRLPTVVDDGDAGYAFHPSLIDAAFQVLITAAVRQRDAGRTSPYLPVGVDRITVLGPPSEQLVVVARVVSSDERLLVSDISVCDPEGRCLIEIEGFRAQSLEASLSLTPERIDAGLLTVDWDPVPEPAEAPREAATADPGDSTWLVLADAGGVGSRLARRAEALGHRVTVVSHGAVAELLTDDDGDLVIDPTAPEQYERLLESLATTTVTRIVHLWSLDAAVDPGAPAARLEDGQQLGALSVMRLVQALSATRGQLPQVWLVTRRAVSLPADGTGPDVAAAPMWGLGRVVGHQEFSSMWGGLVDLDLGDEDRQADMLLAQVEAGGGEDQVAFRDGRRFAARLRPCTDLAQPLPGRLRPDASYLVTGGLGALGLVVARFLGDRGARHVVLTGRRPLPPRECWDQLPGDHPQQAAIRVIRQLQDDGVTVDHVALDVTDAQALAAWHRDHRAAGRPEVRGVVHVAGIVDDQLLVKMDEQQFLGVMRPKLLGGWNLHREFETGGLDFFTLFSSTGSVIASPGQGNYAAGNAFLDALAHLRRAARLPATSIGWGPWSVGMVEELHLEQMYARRGIELITPAAGSQILGRLIGQGPAHVVAVSADWSKARETAVGGRLPAMFADLGAAASSAEPDGGAGAADAVLARLGSLPEDARLAELAAYLRDATARVMGLDPESLGLDDALSGLGMDSMMAIEVKRRIEATLHVEVSVLDLMQRATITTLSAGILGHLQLSPVAGEGPVQAGAPATDVDDELEQLLAQFEPEELERILADLEEPHPAPPAARPGVEQSSPAPRQRQARPVGVADLKSSGREGLQP